jgi:hypothetical protein
MTRYHGTPEGRIPFTAEEETARDAEELAEANAKPMHDWMSSMQGTDGGMPRFLEDLITSNSLVIPAVMRERYDAKIKIRGERP